MGIYNVNGDELLKYTTPEMYGAKGDGVTDDSEKIQSAVNNAGLILFDSTKTYLLGSVVRLKKDTTLELNGATIISTSGHTFYNFKSTDTFTGYTGNGNITLKNGTIIGGCVSFAHGENILLDNIRFEKATEAHFLEIAGCKDYRIKNCSFCGMPETTPSVKEYINIDPVTYSAFPWLANDSAFYDGTKNDGIIIDNCHFSIGTEEYAYGFNAFGVHGVAGQSVKHKNIRLVGNIVRGFTGCGFRINDMENVFISNNDIDVVGDGIRVGDIGQSTNVLIKANVITTSGTAVTKANSSTVFQSNDNDINPTYS